MYRGYFYTNANNGRLTCYGAKTGEIITANPAVSDGLLVIRTLNHVYGIAAPEERR